MIPAALRLFHPHGPDRVAEIAARADTADSFFLDVKRGPSSRQLGKSEVFGPFPLTDLESQRQQLVAALRAEGYWPAGLHAMLTALRDPSPAKRAHAAQRLGWRREREAVEPLLAALPTAGDDTCAILDALGAIGDPRAIPTLRQYATRRLLSRRRSAVEALRLLGDSEGLAQARQPMLDQLPPPVRSALASPSAEAIAGLDPQFKGLALDSLYELAPTGANGIIQTGLAALAFDRPYVWRYVKSILKRAMLRHDYPMFGWLYHEIEVRGRFSAGAIASVKSGYDGAQRSVLIFGRSTQRYLRGLAWRWLNQLANYRSERYAAAAVELMIPFDESDADRFGLLGGVPNVYAVQRVLHGANPDLCWDPRHWRCRFPPGGEDGRPGTRSEMYPELWDLRPRAYLRVLGAAKWPETHVFAVRAIAGEHRRVLEQAPLEDVLPLLDAPYEPTLRLGLEELERRFDPAHPDWELVRRLLADERRPARDTALGWLPLTAALWSTDATRMAEFLAVPDGETRLAVAQLVVNHLSRDPAVRRVLTERLLPVLQQPGDHEAIGLVLREVLAAEVAALLSVADLTTLLARGAAAAKAAAAAALAVKPGALAELGLERVAALALHEVAAVRTAALILVRSAIDQLRDDPALLFVLAESEWPDTREVALNLIRTEIDLPKFGLDGFMGLIDSNRPDVQNHGRDLILRHLDELPILDLLDRLIQHPHANVRHFALDLVVKHLPEEPEALEQALPFCRAILFDMTPSRAAKRRVLEFLRDRGLRDAKQAALAAGLLGEAVRFRTRVDFEQALSGLARLQLAFPGEKKS